MKQNFNQSEEQVHFGNDSIVIKKYIAGVEGGRTLDMTGYADSILKAGHVIITDGKGVWKPMPVSGEAYAALPEGYKYAGVLYRTIQTSKPAAAIMTWGVVNEAIVPFAVDGIKEAFAKDVPQIQFTKDEEA